MLRSHDRTPNLTPKPRAGKIPPPPRTASANRVRWMRSVPVDGMGGKTATAGTPDDPPACSTPAPLPLLLRSNPAPCCAAADAKWVVRPDDVPDFPVTLFSRASRGLV